MQVDPLVPVDATMSPTLLPNSSRTSNNAVVLGEDGADATLFLHLIVDFESLRAPIAQT